MNHWYLLFCFFPSIKANVKLIEIFEFDKLLYFIIQLFAIICLHFAKNGFLSNLFPEKFDFFLAELLPELLIFCFKVALHSNIIV